MRLGECFELYYYCECELLKLVRESRILTFYSFILKALNTQIGLNLMNISRNIPKDALELDPLLI